MKTKHIVSALRAAATPAARLAAWQALPLYVRRKRLTESGGTIAKPRRELINAMGPELSSPEADNPLLWVSEESPEVSRVWTGGEFLAHEGWYTDEFQDGTFQTCAVRLTRFPRLMFYAVMSSMTDDLKVCLDEWLEIDFSECGSEYHIKSALEDAAGEVIRCNDYATQKEAEDEREYQRRWRIENDISENRNTLKTLRGEIRALARELKRLCPSPLAGEYPAATSAVRGKLSDMLRRRAELFAANRELAAEL